MTSKTVLSPWRVLLRLLSALRPFAGWTALSVLLGVGAVGAAVGLLGTSAYLISRAALQPSIADLQVAIVGVRFFGLMRGILRYLERLVTHSVNFRLLARMRVAFFAALEPLAPARLTDSRGGDLLARAVSDIDTLENFYVRAVAPPVIALVITFGTALFVGRWDFRFGLILAGGLALQGLGLPLLIRRLSAAPGRQAVAARADLNTTLVESLQGMSDLLAYGQAETRAAQVQRQGAAVGQAQVSLARTGAAGSAASVLVTQFTLIVMLAAAVPLVSAGEMDGVLLAVLALITLSSFEAAAPLPQAAQQLESSLAAGRRLYEIEDTQPPVNEPAEPSPAPEGVDLSICGLSFGYEAGRETLRDIQVDFPAGKRIALVGPSGAGKTTLALLLLRFLDFECGQMLLAGRDIRSYRGEDVRALAAVVSQSAYIFTASLRQNLLLARGDASEADLLAALERAGLSEWAAALPDGLDTWLGEHGVQMSGGERQRLAAARALLRDRPLLILDEPTANLDAVNERNLMNTLMQVAAGKSLLLITHRLVGLESMDEIVVMEQGQITERGTHAELAAAGGWYAQMWALQRESLAG